jgi:hypothetical protein
MKIDENMGQGLISGVNDTFFEYSKVATITVTPPSPGNLILKKLVNYPSFLGSAEEEEPEGALGHQAGGGEG